MIVALIGLVPRLGLVERRRAADARRRAEGVGSSGPLGSGPIVCTVARRARQLPDESSLHARPEQQPAVRPLMVELELEMRLAAGAARLPRAQVRVNFVRVGDLREARRRWGRGTWFGLVRAGLVRGR